MTTAELQTLADMIVDGLKREILGLGSENKTEFTAEGLAAHLRRKRPKNLKERRQAIIDYQRLVAGDQQ